MQAPGIACAGPAWVTGTRPVMTAEGETTATGVAMRIESPLPTHRVMTGLVPVTHAAGCIRPCVIYRGGRRAPDIA